MNPWVIIKQYGSREEAHMDRAILESCDILARVNGDDKGGLDPLMNYMGAGIRLEVASSRVKEAIKILNDAIIVKNE